MTGGYFVLGRAGEILYLRFGESNVIHFIAIASVGCFRWRAMLGSSMIFTPKLLKDNPKIMEKDELWYFLIGGQQDAEMGCFGNFYSYGTHLGDALNKAILASSNHHFSNQNLLEASLLDRFEEIEDSGELIEIGEGIFMRPTTYSYPIGDTDTEFIPPVGIVKSVLEGEYEYELIKENFVAYGANEDGIFQLELVLAKKNLINVFFTLIDCLPTVDGFWIYIKNYWDNALTELWVAKHFINHEITKEFLTQNSNNTLENGYLDIVVHSKQGETNLTLDDHKKIL
jgi:hypothetical protein